MENSPEKRIVFFDGVCHLCNGFVDLVIKNDPQHRLLFAPLQGETAKNILPSSYLEDLSTVLFWDQGQVYKESEAVLRILRQLPRYQVLARLLGLFPRFVRDFMYKKIARHRYRFFGERDFCRIPTPEEKSYLLP